MKPEMTWTPKEPSRDPHEPLKYQNVANTMQNDRFSSKLLQVQGKWMQMVPGKKAKQKSKTWGKKKNKNYSTPINIQSPSLLMISSGMILL